MGHRGGAHSYFHPVVSGVSQMGHEDGGQSYTILWSLGSARLGTGAGHTATSILWSLGSVRLGIGGGVHSYVHSVVSEMYSSTLGQDKGCRTHFGILGLVSRPLLKREFITFTEKNLI